MLKINNLKNQWKDFKIENINLNIKNQEFFVLLGPTGSGKTLLLELIAGFQKPDKGKILYKNKPYTQLEPEKRDIGFVYQEYSLFPHMNVKENISYGLKEQGLEEAEIEKKVDEMLNLFDITNLEERYPKTLSGGEKQRVSLARAIVIKPDLLLLDEPFNALDEKTHKEMIENIKKLHHELDLTTIHVTHDQTEAMMLADRIGVIMDGEIKQIDKPDKLFNKPKSRNLAKFLGVENIFSAKVTSKADTLDVITLKDSGSPIDIESATDHKLGTNVRVCLRPEDIIVSKSDIQSTARNSITGEVTAISRMGFSVRLKIRITTDLRLTAVITNESLEEMNIEVGSQVKANFKASSIHVINE